MKVLLEWIRDIVIAVVIAFIIMAFFKPILIQQDSMQYNFQPGDYVIVSRQAYHFFGEPEHGDIIVFKSNLTTEEGKQKNLIKRIIGLPGDTIEIKDGYVFLNDKMLDEGYVAEEAMSGNMAKVTVPEGKLFCMGDNRRISADSRDPRIGFVDQESLVGRVVLRLYPFNKIKRF